MAPQHPKNPMMKTITPTTIMKTDTEANLELSSPYDK